MAPFLIAAGFLVILVALAVVALLYLEADMRSSVERQVANDNRPDVTAISLMIVGPGLWVGVLAAALWLGANWS